MVYPADEKKNGLDNYLTFADGIITLGDKVLPGVLSSVHVGGGIRLDKSNLDQMSGTVKIFMGWEDSDVSITLDLLCDQQKQNGVMVDHTCYTKLDIINRMFKKADSAGCPLVYSIQLSHLTARGVRQVIFERLESCEDSESDVIQATLTFTEYLPDVIRREKQANASKEAIGAPSIKLTKQPEVSSKIVKDNDSAFITGLKAGMK